MATTRTLYTGEVPIVIEQRDRDMTAAEQMAATMAAAQSGGQTDQFFIPYNLTEIFVELFINMEIAVDKSPRMALETPQNWPRGPGDEIVVQRCRNIAMPAMLFVGGYASDVSTPLAQVLMSRSGLFTPAPGETPDITMELYQKLEDERHQKFVAAAGADPLADQLPQLSMGVDGVVRDQAGNVVSALPGGKEPNPAIMPAPGV